MDRNLVGNERLIIMLLKPGAREYMDTPAKLKATLDIRTIVPGHGPLEKPVVFERTIACLGNLTTWESPSLAPSADRNKRWLVMNLPINPQ
jgi:hypothetical protein